MLLVVQEQTVTYRTQAQGDTLLIAQGATVQALDVASGHVRWTFELNAANYKWGEVRVCASADRAFIFAIADEPTNFFGQAVTPELLVLELHTGRLLARNPLPISVPLGNGTNVSLLLDRGLLFVGIAAQVFAVDTHDGGLRWSYHMPLGRPTDEQGFHRMAMAVAGHAVQPD